MTRVYLSNIREAWPITRQEELLDLKVPGWRGMAVYRDVLSKRGVTRGEKLVQRDEILLRPTGRVLRDGVLIVATLPVLARTPTDLTAVLLRLAARHEKLKSVAEDMEIDPANADLEAVKAAFLSASRRFSAIGVSGGVASGKKRSMEADAKIELIRPFWHLFEPSTNELCKTYGVSRPTVILKLGSRRAAQKEYQDDLRRQVAALKVAEANRRRRKRGANTDEE